MRSTTAHSRHSPHSVAAHGHAQAETSGYWKRNPGYWGPACEADFEEVPTELLVEEAVKRATTAVVEQEVRAAVQMVAPLAEAVERATTAVVEAEVQAAIKAVAPKPAPPVVEEAVERATTAVVEAEVQAAIEAVAAAPTPLAPPMAQVRTWKESSSLASDTSTHMHLVLERGPAVKAATTCTHIRHAPCAMRHAPCAMRHALCAMCHARART